MSAAAEISIQDELAKIRPRARLLELALLGANGSGMSLDSASGSGGRSEPSSCWQM